jgi:hypothetical protein
MAESREQLWGWKKKNLAPRLRMLREARIGQFQLMGADPSFRKMLFPVVPTAMNRMTWHNGVGRGDGEDSYLLFALKHPRPVYAVRIRYSYKNALAALFQMYWRTEARSEFTKAQSRSFLLPLWGVDESEQEKQAEKTITIWVDGVIDQFRIHPDQKPFVLEISEIVLLLPEDDER